jgi:hypothetical protein
MAVQHHTPVQQDLITEAQHQRTRQLLIQKDPTQQVKTLNLTIQKNNIQQVLHQNTTSQQDLIQ